MINLPHIVVVDDELDRRQLSLLTLNELNPARLHGLESVQALLMYVAESLSTGQSIDLILMDVHMPNVDGIEGCRQIRQIPVCHDIPILMLSSADDPKTLKAAFEAGAMDYIRKTHSPIELVTRVRSALKLKYEMDERKQREAELLSLTRQLMAQKEVLEAEATAHKKSSYQDELTGVYNAKAFDHVLRVQWNQAYKKKQALSLLLIGVDFFNEYNLHYGREKGDALLKTMASWLPANTENTFSLRYDGTVFAVILNEDSYEDMPSIASRLLKRTRDARLEHATSEVDTIVSVSIGCALQQPQHNPDLQIFLKMAQQGLLEARRQGHNRIVQQISLQDNGPFTPLY